MARIGDGLLKNWLDGSVVKAAEYKQEREILRVAINDNYDRLILKYDKSEVDTLLSALGSDLENSILDNANNLAYHKVSSDHDGRYHVKAEITSFLDALKGPGYSAETLSGLKSDFTNLQNQINGLNNVYSTDAERIAAINDVIAQFELADGDLNTLIQNKANKSDVYTKDEVNSTQLVQDNRLTSMENNTQEFLNRIAAEESRNTQQDGRLLVLEGTIGQTYTKPETDTLLNLKANKSDVYTKAEQDLFNAGLTVDSEVITARLGSDGTAHANLKNRLDKMEGNLIDKDRLSQTLAHGLSIFTAALNSPVEVEVQGRTLISLGNSNLEGNKNYVLSAKNFKIRAEGREGTLINGVAKFTKSASVMTKADFVGKVSGSVTENAHIAKYNGQSTLQTPTGTWGELSAFSIGKVQTLNSDSLNLSTSANGAISQFLASFNIIEQIERKLGRIPADTVSGKVQWIKDNVQRLTASWHGWGSSVGGNGATFVIWKNQISNWSVSRKSHANGTVTKIGLDALYDGGVIGDYIDSNGMMHALAYTTNPSDGATPSQLNTDFIECEIELKSTAVLDTRPIVTRTATFEGKVSGDLVSNPHVAKARYTDTTLMNPNNAFSDFSANGYGSIQKLGDTPLAVTITTASTPNLIAQQLFSWNLIAEIENNIGRIPKATVAEKVQWVKDNVEVLSCDWYGFGSSVGGNGATFGCWNGSGFNINLVTNSNGAPTKTTLTIRGSVPVSIDSSGFVHYLAWTTNPSDGVTASTINTDHISLDITLKQGATLFDPILPLYEISDANEFSALLTTIDETNVLLRYPKVSGVQHLSNVAVIAEGENLLPPFSEWTLNPNVTVKSSYDMELNATSGSQISDYTVNVMSNTQYNLSLKDFNYSSGQRIYLYYDGVLKHSSVASNSFSFVTDPTTKTVKVAFFSNAVGKFTFTNPMLTLGNVAKPFVPRNPSYLFAPIKLGQIGDKKDILFSQDGQWVVRKLVEKDLELTGISAEWVRHNEYSGFKSAYILKTVFSGGMFAIVTDHKGTSLNRQIASTLTWYNQFYTSTAPALVVSVANEQTGFPEVFTPTSSDWNRYFNGWKYTDGTTWTSVTGNGQTATASVALSTKPTDYVPYKISYLLATPQMVNVNHLVEGSIAVSGSTQVEVTSGVVVREKVSPQLHANGTVYINDASNLPLSKVKNKVEKFMGVYKNGNIDNVWKPLNTTLGQAFGKQLMYTLKADYDTTATYEVTYLVLDRHLFSNNATEIKASYNGSLKDVLDDSVVKISDLTTQTSILNNQMYRVLVALKGASINV